MSNFINKRGCRGKHWHLPFYSQFLSTFRNYNISNVIHHFQQFLRHHWPITTSLSVLMLECSVYYKSYYFHIPTRQQSSYFHEPIDLSSRSTQSTFCLLDLYRVHFVWIFIIFSYAFWRSQKLYYVIKCFRMGLIDLTNPS